MSNGQTMNEVNCEACLRDYHGEHYVCSLGCNYAICAGCAECMQSHQIKVARGTPKINEFCQKTILCDRCNKTGLQVDPFFWHCDSCKWNCCTRCMPAADWEVEHYPQLLLLKSNVENVVPQLNLN